MKGKIAITIITGMFAFGAYAAKKDPIVATINGVTIKKSVFEKSYKQNLVFVSDKVVSREKVINDLINRELGIQRARRNKLSKDPVVREKMEDIMYHAQVSKDLEPRLKQIVVTDKDVETYYSGHPEYRTAHILFRMKALPEENEWKAAQQQALKVFKSIEKRPDLFSEMANRYSQTSTAPNGGDIGFQPAVKLAPEYFEAINGKGKNYITSPVRTQFGYHIIKILAVKKFKSINTALYKKIVYDIKRDKVLAGYFTELRKSAKIKINKSALKE